MLLIFLYHIYINKIKQKHPWLQFWYLTAYHKHGILAPNGIAPRGTPLAETRNPLKTKGLGPKYQLRIHTECYQSPIRVLTGIIQEKSLKPWYAKLVIKWNGHVFAQMKISQDVSNAALEDLESQNKKISWRKRFGKLIQILRANNHALTVDDV